MELSAQRIIVTGAGGFLGRHLCRALAGMGHEVIPVSRSPGPGRVTVDDYRQAPPGDVLVHLAQEPDRARFNAGGGEAVNAAVALLESLSQGPWQRMVYASSAAVYGDTGTQPAGVSTEVDARDHYNRCKLACEARVLERGGVVARLANLYGKGMAPGCVVAEILAQIPGSGPLHVRDAAPVRDYLHVQDAAAAIALLTGRACTGLFNIGSGVGLSVGELAALALELAGEGARQVVAATARPQSSCCVLDITATREATGWVPRIPLREGLEELIAAARTEGPATCKRTEVT